MQLRAYQIELVDAVHKAYKQGYKRPCIVLGCGGGKSIIVAEMAKRTTDGGKRVLFLVHRRELCEQIRRTFCDYGVNMRLCKVGMVQTIVRRLGKLEKPALIITDENHHCLATSYKKIYEHWPDVYCVGITATPVRLNGDGLGDVNDKLIIGKSTRWLINHHFLADYDYYAPDIADLTGLHTRRGEYVISEIEQKMIKDAVFGDVIKYYKQLSSGKQAICYCASIKHSLRMAQEFNAAGIPAAHIDGKTDKGSRRKIIDKFRSGEITILCNVDLISEGFDVPDCTTSILLRPTKSLTLFIQQSMRCMRYKEGKRAVIIDHVGNYARFGLPDLDREWTLDKKEKNKRNQEESKEKIRQCPRCFFVHPFAPECPECDYVYPVKERVLEEEKEAELQQVPKIVLDYSTPQDCKNIDELRQYAKRKGYKPGWAYYQAKARGMIG